MESLLAIAAALESRIVGRYGAPLPALCIGFDAAGIPHDRLLEAAVFLVSIQLMWMTHRNSGATPVLDAKLDCIHEAVMGHDRRSEFPAVDTEQGGHR